MALDLCYCLSYRDSSTVCRMLTEIREAARAEKWLYWINSLTFMCTVYLSYGDMKCRLVLGMLPLTTSWHQQVSDSTEEIQPCPQDRAMYRLGPRSHNRNIPLCFHHHTLRFSIPTWPAESQNSSTDVIKCREVNSINEETKNGS